MPRTKWITYKDLLNAFRDRNGGVAAVKRLVGDVECRGAIRRLIEHLKSHGSTGDKALLEWARASSKPGKAPPIVGETRRYKAIHRKNGIPVLRVPLHHMGEVKLDQEFATTFEGGSIVIGRIGRAAR